MWWIFPPKNLEKYGAQNTHAPIFFKKKKKSIYIVNKQKI